jgi:F-type H+-transporting ATPase subunit b
MPQLDTSTFSGQIFWLLVAFLILFAVVRSVAAPRLMGMAARRADQQAADYAAAEAARTLENAKQAEHEAEIEAAHVKARTELAEATDAARAQAAAKLAELGARLKAQGEVADAALATTRTAAEADLQVVADDVANDLVRRLTGAAA